MFERLHEIGERARLCRLNETSHERDGIEHELRAGMVVAAEPGVYEEGLGGFRWEDDAVVTDDGARRLAETSYGLD